MNRKVNLILPAVCLVISMLLAGCSTGTDASGQRRSRKSSSTEDTVPAATAGESSAPELETSISISDSAPAETEGEDRQPSENGSDDSAASETGTERGTSSVELRDDEKAAGECFREAGEFLYNWYFICAYTDETDTLTGENGMLWQRVSYPGVSTIGELQALTRQHFTAEATDEIIANSTVGYREFDGTLYSLQSPAMGDVFCREYALLVQPRSDDRFHIVTMYESESDGWLPWAEAVELVREGNRWVFDAPFSASSPGTVYTVMNEAEMTHLLKSVALTLSNSVINADSYPVPRRVISYDPECWTCGRDVCFVQAALIEMNYDGVAVNGVFDWGTQAALKRFQRNHELPQTGVVDADMAEKLGYYLQIWRAKQGR